MHAIDEIELLLTGSGGVVARRDHPDLRVGFDYLLRRNALIAVLPGVYAIPAAADDPQVKMRAAIRRHPDAVLLGSAAAQLTYWPEVSVDAIDVAVPSTARPHPGFAFSRRSIPPELVLERPGLRCSTPALTAIDLATIHCADGIDIALRTRTATLEGMYDALRLTPNRSGNNDRRRVLIDSRNEPWSAAERLSHRALRKSPLTGWRTNWPVVIEGLGYFIDIAFPAQRLAIEIDGRLHETKEDLFQSDRWRQNALALAGWRVIRFTFEMVRDHPDLMVAVIRRMLRV